jgi:hypothetical protein
VRRGPSTTCPPTHANKFKAPDFSFLICAILASVYLVYTSVVGVSVVDIRSLSVLLEMLALGAGVLLTATKGEKKEEWEKKVGTPGMIIAGITGILVTLIVIPSVVVVPHVSLVLQPSFQVVMTILVGLVIYEVSRILRKRNNIDLDELIKKSLPLE